MKSVLMIPDIRGWAVENMADNIMATLSDEFNFEKVIAEDLDPADFKKYIKAANEKFSLIYIMLPSYVQPEFGIDKIITTFHGGPGTEGQADALDRQQKTNMCISYVSHQVRDRVMNYEWKSNRKVKSPVKAILDEDGLLAEQNIDRKDIIKMKIEISNALKNPGYRVPINLHLWRRGFGLKNVNYFTPHGINPSEYVYSPIKHKEFTCGYAGWGKYLLGTQQEHRRCNWIFDSWGYVKYYLKCASGLKEHAEYDTNILRVRYKENPMYEFNTYSKEQMSNFYNSLDCYLVPDHFAGGPMPVLEAGICAVPPVCTRAGVCGDIIKHMKTGYVCESFEDFVEGIRFMKDNPDKRVEMGHNLREYLLKNRTWHSVKTYWRDFFNAQLI